MSIITDEPKHNLAVRIWTRIVEPGPLHVIASSPRTPRAVLNFLFKFDRFRVRLSGAWVVPSLWKVILANPNIDLDAEPYRKMTRETLISAKASNVSATDAQLRAMVDDFAGSTTYDMSHRFSNFVRAVEHNPNASAETIAYMKHTLHLN